MPIASCFPSPARLLHTILGLDPSIQILAVDLLEAGITIHCATTLPQATCPDCQHPSTTIHSRYHRHIADLPWGTWPVTLRIIVRKFRCCYGTCPRKIWTERLATVVAPSARMTLRRRSTLRSLAFALGGEAGARLAATLRLPTSPDTLLQIIRQTAVTEDQAAPPTVIGLDDWAFRKGISYGTIVVNLETHRPIDIVPERTPACVAAWLQAHPTITTIARDRGTEYITAIRQGAPTVTEVADRWHLIQNWRTVLDKTLNSYRHVLKTIPKPTASPPHPPPAATALPSPRVYRRQKAADRQRAMTQARREVLWTTIRARRALGEYYSTMAHELKLHVKTVRKYAQADTCPQTAAYPPRRRLLGPFEPYLRARWAEGCRNGKRLYRELETYGYGGSRSSVSMFVAQLRRDTAPAAPAGMLPLDVLPLLLTPTTTAAETDLLAAIAQAHPDLATLMTLSREWLAIVRTRTADQLDSWLDRASACSLRPVYHFAVSVKKDLAAVRNGCSLMWSNGQTEGQVNRLKLIKRQMYGRAKFDLLRQRVLYRGDIPGS